MIDITKTQIEETIEALRLDHSFANNSCPVPIILERLGEIHALAIRGLETQWRPIDQSPKDGTDILAFGGRRGSEMSGHEYEVDHEGPTLVSWESGHWWEPGEMCNYVKPTKFILLSALGEPK